MTFAPIGETIKRGTWRGPVRGIYLSLRMEKVFSELLPQLLPSIANEVRMLSYREGRLSLRTPSPVISQEVYLSSTEIIKRLNGSLGEGVVKEIRCRIGTKPNLALKPHRHDHMEVRGV